MKEAELLMLKKLIEQHTLYGVVHALFQVCMRKGDEPDTDSWEWKAAANEILAAGQTAAVRRVS